MPPFLIKNLRSRVNGTSEISSHPLITEERSLKRLDLTRIRISRVIGGSQNSKCFLIFQGVKLIPIQRDNYYWTSTTA